MTAFFTLLPYFFLDDRLPEAINALKIEEAISIVRIIDKDVDSMLFDFTQPGKINLYEFMERNYMFHLSPKKFSYLTRRSLFAVNRDFRHAFQTSPQKWLTQNRLALAKEKLNEEKRKPIDVYWEVEFENLSHFSYTFKKQYGYALSEIL